VEQPLVHHATIDLRAEFSDFDALSTWLTTTAELSGVSIGNIEWRLLDETRERVTAELRALAVEDAFGKARSYAAAIGRSEVTPESLTEADEGQMLLTSSAKFRGGGPDVEFTPSPVHVTVRVEVRFSAS
jgi:uncharacterized protein YggE